MLKKIFKILTYTVVVISLLLIVLYGFTQTKYFKEKLRVVLVSELSQSLDSEFYLGTIKGNFLLGFYIDSISIYRNGVKFLSVNGVKLSHDPFTIVGKKITIRKIQLEYLDVNIFKGSDSIWNVSKIFKPSKAESKPFDWTIDIREFRILDGKFALYDSTFPAFRHPKDSITKYLDYRHLMVEKFKIDLSGYFKDKYYKLKIKETQFIIPDIEFALNTFALDLRVENNILEVKNLLVETDSTSFKIDASLNDLNIFQKIKLVDFEDKPVKLKLISNKFNLNEFKKFLPAVYFLNGTLIADIEADGVFSNLKINTVNLKIFDSYLLLDGNLINLHNPRNLFLNIRLNNSEVLPTDVNKLLPLFKIPRFDNVKSITLNANYYGTPLDFSSKLNLSSSTIGNAIVDLKLNLTDTVMKYDVELRTQNLDLQPITKLNSLRSQLNIYSSIRGEGVKINNLGTTLTLKCDSSYISDFNLEFLDLNTVVSNKKIDSEIRLDTDIGRILAKANLDFEIIDFPKLKVDAKIAHLNISKFINDERKKSDLNFDIRSFIQGKNIDQINGDMIIDLKKSEISGNVLDAQVVNINLKQENIANKELKISSNTFEFGINGKFNLSSTPEMFGVLVQNVIKEVHKRVDYRIAKEEENIKNDISELEDFNLSYRFYAKDLSLLSKMFSSVPFNYNGEVVGDFKYFDGNLIGESSIKINDLFFGQESNGILISNASSYFKTGPVNLHFPLEESNITLHLTAEKINLNRINILETKLNLEYKDAYGTLEVNSKFEEDRKLYTKLQIFTKPEYFQFVSDLFGLTLNNYSINADTTMSFRIDNTGVNVENFKLISSSKEKFILNGTIKFDNTIKLDTRIDDFLFENLQFIVKKSTGFSKISGNADLNMIVEGTLTEPIIDCQVNFDSLNYKNSSIGKLNGLLTYKNKKLNISVIALNPELVSETILTISGVLPVDLALSSVENRFPDENVTLKIKTDGFPLAILNPLIPNIDNLSGKLICDLKIGGTALKPNYFGKIDLKDVKFLLLTNYINYNITGSLVSDYDKINLVDFSIENEKTDFADGKLYLSGFFTIKEYKFDNFNLNAKGQLLLLKEGIIRRMHSIYGKLIATTEEEGITFKGTISNSNISGAIVIKEANLVFPPSQNQIYTETDNLIRYVAVNDTLFESPKRDIKKEYYIARISNRESYWIEEMPTSSRFLNGLTYDLALSTKGTTNIRMIFNPTTNEELYAELDGKIYIQRYSNRNYFIGEISISDRSYYNFFKKFEAAGKLKFIGDPNNPELDIKATYTGFRQVQASPQDTTIIDQKVIIGLDITGTRLEPNLKMSIKIDDKDYNELIQSGDLQSDAISFLFTNKFKDDLTNKEKSEIIAGIGTSAGKSIIAGATSTMLSGILTDFLRKEFGFIRTAEVTYAGGSLQQSADLRLSGQIFNAYWRFGGKIFDDINNANVSFILNFGDVFNSPKVKNFFLELERKVDGRDYGIDKKLTNSAKIYYKWSF